MTCGGLNSNSLNASVTLVDFCYLCKQYIPRSGLTSCQARSGDKLFNTLRFHEKVYFEKKSTDGKRLEKLPNMQRVNTRQEILLFFTFFFTKWGPVGPYQNCLNEGIIFLNEAILMGVCT